MHTVADVNIMCLWATFITSRDFDLFLCEAPKQHTMLFALMEQNKSHWQQKLSADKSKCGLRGQSNHMPHLLLKDYLSLQQTCQTRSSVLFLASKLLGSSAFLISLADLLIWSLKLGDFTHFIFPEEPRAVSFLVSVWLQFSVLHLLFYHPADDGLQ